MSSQIQESYVTENAEQSADCLRLMKMEFVELLHVADTSEELRTVAQSVFARKYGHMYVVVRPSSIHYSSDYVIGTDRIDTRNVEASLKILRCFGSAIRKLEMCHWERDSEDQLAHAWNHMSQYCAAFVTEVLFNDRFHNKFAFGIAATPFDKVEKLFFKECELEKHFNHLTKNFPNVRELEFEGCRSSNLRTHLPCLERLTVSSGYEYEKLTELIRWNPQIKSLHLRMGVKYKHIELISDGLDKLETLDITTQDWRDSAKFIRFKHLKRLTFGYFCTSMPRISSVYFGRIGELEIVPDFWDRESGLNILNFVKQYTRVYKFICQRMNRGSIVRGKQHSLVNPELALEIAKRRKSIVELDVRAIFFRVDEAINLFRECSHVKIFYFKLAGQYDDLKKKLLNMEWTSSIEGAELVKLQR